MKAIRYLGEGRHELAEVPAPTEPELDEVLVDVVRSGICGTDLKILSVPPGHSARPGVILGHEFVGTVASVGAEVHHLRGSERVAIAPDQGCGLCRACQRGHPMLCSDPVNLGLKQDGGLAERAVVPARAVHVLPDKLGWREASLVEPLSCVLEALKPVRLEPGLSAAVVGAGPMGLLAVAVLATSGVRPLLAFEPSPVRAELALSCGATQTADGAEISGRVWESSTGSDVGPQIVVEATGHLLAECLELVGARGTVVQLGYNEAAAVRLAPRLINQKAISIVGSDGNEFTFSDAIDLAASGRLPLAKLVTAEVEIDRFPSAVQRMREGRDGKVTIAFDLDPPRHAGADSSPTDPEPRQHVPR